MNKDNKPFCKINIRNAFLEISIGISANSFLLLFHIFVFIHGHRPKLSDLTIGFVVLTHLMLLLIAVYRTQDVFISPERWEDIACKLLIVLQGFSRPSLFVPPAC